MCSFPPQFWQAMHSDHVHIPDTVLRTMADNPFISELARANGLEGARVIQMFVDSHVACVAVLDDHGYAMATQQPAASAHELPLNASSSSAAQKHAPPSNSRTTASSDRESSRLTRAHTFDGVLQQLPEDIRGDADVQSRMWKAINTPAIYFKLPKPNATEGIVLRMARATIATIRGRFKVGISQDPAFRWSNGEYGYARSGEYKRMVIIYASASASAAGMLEAMLIASNKASSTAFCDNVAPGGESKTRAPASFVYVVHA